MTAHFENIAAATAPVLALGGPAACSDAAARCLLANGSEFPAAQGQVKPHHRRFWELEYELGPESFPSTDHNIPGAERVAVWICLLAPGNDSRDPNPPIFEAAA